MNRRAWMHRAALLAASAPWLLHTGHASACEFASGSLVVDHPWTRASLPGAREAKLCMRLKDIQHDDRLIALRTPVATGAHWHTPKGPLPLADHLLRGGADIELREDGMHLRLVGLREPLVVGRVLPLHLSFAEGGLVHAQLHVDFEAGSA